MLERRWVRRVVVVRRCFLAFAPTMPPMIAPAMKSPASASTRSAGISATAAASTAPVVNFINIVLLQMNRDMRERLPQYPLIPMKTWPNPLEKWPTRAKLVNSPPRQDSP